MSRESQTDNDRTGATAAQYRKEAQVYDIPFQGVETLQDEKDDGGWLEKDEPVGAEPRDICTAGTRGRADELGPKGNPDMDENLGY